MAETVRVALTETRNAYDRMPARVEEVAQLAGRLDDVRAANLDHNAALIRAAAAAGARIVGLGELFPGPYFALREDPLWRELAEDAFEGPSIARVRELARAHALVIVAPIYELAAGGRRFNTAVVVDAAGEVLGRYRKTHVPEGQNERAGFHERFYYDPGDGDLEPQRGNVSKNPHFPVFETAVGRVGVAICYDRHFREVVPTLAREGAEIVFSPAVTFGARSRRMWDMEFEVDAMRSGVFVCGSNRVGAEPPWNVEFFGQSHVAGPRGRLPAVPAPDGLVLADLDLGDLRAPDTSGWDLARDERPGVYTPPTAGRTE